MTQQYVCMMQDIEQYRMRHEYYYYYYLWATRLALVETTQPQYFLLEQSNESLVKLNFLPLASTHVFYRRKTEEEAYAAGIRAIKKEEDWSTVWYRHFLLLFFAPHLDLPYCRHPLPNASSQISRNFGKSHFVFFFKVSLLGRTTLV